MKGSRGEGSGSDRRAREPRPARLAADSQADFRQIEPIGAAERAEQVHVGAGAAAAVEQASVGHSGGRALEQRRDERAEAAEPKMARFRSCGRAQQMFHGALYRLRHARLFDSTIPTL